MAGLREPAAKRRRLGFDEHDWHDIPDQMARLNGLRFDYSGVYDKMDSFEDPRLGKLKARVDKNFDSIRKMLDTCATQLDARMKKYEASLKKMEAVALEDGEWWRLVNILSPILALGYIKKIDANPPSNPQIWLSYLKGALKEPVLLPMEPYIGQHGYRFDRNNVDQHVNKISANISREMDRLVSMREGLNCAVELYLFVKLDFLPHQNIYSYEHRNSLFRHCKGSDLQSVDESFERILNDIRVSRARPGLGNGVQDIDAVTRCRDIIKLMDSRCQGYRRHSKSAHLCIRPYAYKALELIYEHAQFEIRQKVLGTIGTCLPRELSDMVAEWAIAAEDLPADGKVYDPSQSEDNMDGYGRKEVFVFEEYQCPVWRDQKARIHRARYPGLYSQP